MPFLTGITSEPVELPKYLFFCFLAIFSLFFVNFSQFKLSRLDSLYLLWVAVGLLSSLLGSNPHDGIFGQYYRYQGAIFYLLFWIFSLYLRQTLSFGFLRPLLNLACLLLATSLLTSALLSHFGFPVYQLIPGRFAFTFGNPNFAGAFLSLSSVFLPPIFLPLVFIALLTTQSLSALLGFIYLLCLYLFPHFRPKIFFFLGLLLIGLIYSLFFRFQSFDQKPKVWLYSLSAFKSRPLLGWGRENLATGIATVLPHSEFDLKNVKIDKAHNLLLEQLAETGLIGTLLFLLLNYYLYLHLPKASQPLFWIFHLLSQFNVLNLTSWLFFLLLFSLSCQALSKSISKTS